MTTAYTSLLGLALPVTGELSGTWGDTVNNYLTNYIDAAVAGAQTISTDTSPTLTKTTGTSLGSTSSQYAIINCTGARTALRTITVPAASKVYLVINGTSGGYGVKVVGAGPTTGVTIANGKAALIAWNGTDFVTVASNDASVLGGILAVANGGTGLSSGTSGGVPYFSGTTTIASSAALAANAIVLGGGAGAAPATTTTGTGVVTALGVNVGSAGAVVVNGGALGTPASGTLTNATGLPLTTGVTGTLPVANGGTGLTATPTNGQVDIGNGSGFTRTTLTAGSGVSITNGSGSITISATGSGGTVTSVTASSPLASSGGATPNISITSSTGSGAVVLASSPTLTTPNLGTPSAATLTNATGLPLSTGVTGTLPVANGGTGLTATPSNGQIDIGNGSGFTRTTLTAGANITVTNGAGSITIASSGSAPTLNVVSGTTQTASANNHYVLTNASATTVTLPASPAAGDVVWVTVGNSLTTNVVARNGNKIQSLSEDLTLNAKYAAVQMRYINSTIGWTFV